MYITDARHLLDDKGAIAPRRGPAKAMADFHAGVIAYATDFDDAGVTMPPRQADEGRADTPHRYDQGGSPERSGLLLPSAPSRCMCTVR
jgi:hypothetical protein